ncbi:MAG: hypothetical protein J5804_00550 [Eggerthellaceae bacterium]|nr:hypothetical protein [Eggerthellaceae bacterium]
MKRVVATLALVVIVVPVAVGAYLYFSEGGHSASASITPVSSIVAHGGDTTVSGLNATIDASGIKDQIDSSLRSNAGTIANRLGVTEEEVNTAIDALDIKDWEVATLPQEAVATGAYQVDYADTKAQITTYDDPSYVTVSAYEQDITLSVPESAQGSLILFGVLS